MKYHVTTVVYQACYSVLSNFISVKMCSPELAALTCYLKKRKLCQQ